MPTEHYADFDALPWAKALLSDRTITKYQLVHRNLPPPFNKDISNSFFGKTLFTEGAIRAYQPMYRSPPSSLASISATMQSSAGYGGTKNAGERGYVGHKGAISADALFDFEAYILVSIGSECDGGTARLHGGLSSALLDQVMGLLVSIVHANTPATKEMTVRFKKVVRTPMVLLCRARIVGEDGRRVRTRGWVEDGSGVVFCEGEGLFVKSREKI